MLSIGNISNVAICSTVTIPSDIISDLQVVQDSIKNAKSNLSNMNSELDPLKTAELERIASETSRNLAERKKLINEAAEIDRKLKNQWLTTGLPILVSGFLLGWWFITNFQPIFEKKNTLASLKNEIALAQNDKDRLKYEQDKEALQELTKTTDKQLSGLKKEYDAISEQLLATKLLNTQLLHSQNELANEYKKLAKINNVNVAEKAKYEKLADDARLKSIEVQKQIDKITATQSQAETLTNTITDQVLSNWLIANTWEVFIDGKKNMKNWVFHRNGIADAFGFDELLWTVENGLLKMKDVEGFAKIEIMLSTRNNSYNGNFHNYFSNSDQNIQLNIIK